MYIFLLLVTLRVGDDLKACTNGILYCLVRQIPRLGWIWSKGCSKQAIQPCLAEHSLVTCFITIYQEKYSDFWDVRMFVWSLHVCTKCIGVKTLHYVYNIRARCKCSYLVLYWKMFFQGAIWKGRSIVFVYKLSASMTSSLGFLTLFTVDF